MILAFRALAEKLELDFLCVLCGSVVSDLFIWAGGILVDETVFFLAKDGQKGATATRAVSPFVLRPVGISAV